MNKKLFPIKQSLIVLGLVLTFSEMSLAQDGVSSFGATGGLTIPNAEVLKDGYLAASVSNYQEARLGHYDKRENYTLGFGLLPNVELFGRFAEYVNKPIGWLDANGVRDLSANVKWQLPLTQYPILPNFAVGMTDLSGGAVFFKSAYAVASDEYGWLAWTLGYGKSSSENLYGNKMLDGPFGGLEVSVLNTGARVLAEYDGMQSHLGLRYATEPLSWLGRARLTGTVQHSFGASYANGVDADKTSLGFSLSIPLSLSNQERELYVKSVRELPSIEELAAKQQGSDSDVLLGLQAALTEAGFDRVRVGSAEVDTVVVEYENYRYLQNEADGLGIALGVVAELSPASTQDLVIRQLKAGQVISSVKTAKKAFQQYLRDGDVGVVRPQIEFAYSSLLNDAEIKWLGVSKRKNKVRLELSPVLNYALGTEYGAFDYALGLRLRAKAPLWHGAELYGDLVGELNHTDNVDDGRVFDSMKIRNGLKTLVLQQSLWLGKRAFVSGGMGLYNYEGWGGEAEGIMFTPWADDTIHLRGSHRQYSASYLAQETVSAATLAYRKKFNEKSWLELGYNQYTDESRGPSLRFTRWFGDVAVELSGRKGGVNKFAGLEVTIPLTPRKGMAANTIQMQGNPQFGTGVHTRLVGDSGTGNYISDDSAIPMTPHYNIENEQLNVGRISGEYFKTQLPRMRESFMIHARNLVD